MFDDRINTEGREGVVHGKKRVNKGKSKEDEKRVLRFIPISFFD